MIDYKELRLGNYVMVTHDTEVMGIISTLDLHVPIDNEHPCTANVSLLRQLPDLVTGVICPSNRLIPIPLDAELFRKMGFREFGPERSEKPHFMCCNRPLVISVTSEVPDTFRKWEVNIYHDKYAHIGRGYVQYLHQLQNFVFGCTGEEISIEL